MRSRSAWWAPPVCVSYIGTGRGHSGRFPSFLSKQSTQAWSGLVFVVFSSLRVNGSEICAQRGMCSRNDPLPIFYNSAQISNEFVCVLIFGIRHGMFVLTMAEEHV